MPDHPVTAGAARRNRCAGPVACIDLETTGGMAAHHRVIEVGIVLLDEGQVVEEWSTPGPSGHPYSCVHRLVHGNHDDMVADAPTLRRSCAAKSGGASRAGCSSRTTRVSTTASCAPSSAGSASKFRGAGALHGQAVARAVRRACASQPRHADRALRADVRRAAPGARRCRRCCRHFSLRWSGSGRRRALHEARHWQRCANRDCRRTCRLNSPTICPRARACTCSAARAARCCTSARAATCAVACSTISRANIVRARSRSSRGRCGRSNGSRPAASSARCCSSRGSSRNWRRAPTVACAGATATVSSCSSRRRGLESRKSCHWTSPAAQASAEPYGPFRSERDAWRACEGKAREAGLCLKVLGLETGRGLLLRVPGRKCRGACVGQEPRALHDARLQLALASLRMKPWPFAGAIGIREPARRARQRAARRRPLATSRHGA